MFNIINHIPDGLLAAEVTELESLLGGPTLMHLPGRHEAPLFVSVLLHGNEDTGYYAVRKLLDKYRDQELPRSLSVFFGNVSAAALGQRRLDGQPDYNRVWPGAEHEDCPEKTMMRDIVREMEKRRVFAAIDVHNNTGLNPHYGCVNRIDHRYFHLATLFSRTVVYFTRPRGVASLGFAPICPSVTVECGRPGHSHGVDHAMEFIEAALHLADIPVHPIAPHDIDLFHTVVIVKVPDEIDFAFGNETASLNFLPDIDHLNFRELREGTELARVNRGDGELLDVRDERGRNAWKDYFLVEDGILKTRRAVMPSMFTLDERIVRQDCLCYLMERYELVPPEQD